MGEGKFQLAANELGVCLFYLLCRGQSTCQWLITQLLFAIGSGELRAESAIWRVRSHVRRGTRARDHTAAKQAKRDPRLCPSHLKMKLTAGISKLRQEISLKKIDVQQSYLCVRGPECIFRAWSNLISTAQLSLHLAWNFIICSPTKEIRCSQIETGCVLSACKLMLNAYSLN